MKWYLRIQQRLTNFWRNSQLGELHSVRFLSNITGWFVTLIFLILSWQKGSNWWQVWIFFHAYYWYGINKDVLRIFRPPAEILFFPLYLIFTLDLGLIRAQLESGALKSGNIFFAQAPHLVLMAIVILALGLLIIISGRRNTELARVARSTDSEGWASFSYRQGALVMYVALGYLGHLVVMYDSGYYIYIFRVLLFLLLLQKTHWLEKLSKTELNVYFVISALLFLIFRGHDTFTEIRTALPEPNLIWFSLPYYLYLLLKMYLLALLIRLPVVMVYNHAGLSRKLRISSLLQSTVPQIIQFISLMLVFYFFIAGWQSVKMRDNFIEQIRPGKQVSEKRIDGTTRMTQKTFEQQLAKTGYSKSGFPDQGVVVLPSPGSDGKIPEDHQRLSPQRFVFYSIDNNDSADVVNLTVLDSSFVRSLTKEAHLMAASGLMAYSYSPSKWERLFYLIRFGDLGGAIKVLPFALFSSNNGWSIQSQYVYADGQKEKRQVTTREAIFNSGEFVIGRVYIPVINSSNSATQYFVIDAFMQMEFSFFKTPMAMLMLALLLLFLLFNGLITQRVISLGAEINKSIIQKFAYLKRGIREVATGNLSYRVELEGEDEFVELAGHFNQMGKRLEKTIEEAREKDRLNEELRIARRVQRNMLSSELPDVPGYRLAADLNTATEVGGDFYDFMPIGDEKFLFTLGDVSGKGSSAAFYMAQIMSLLRYSHQFTDEPKEIARRINHYFATQVADKQIFITAIIGVLDAKKHSIRFVRAGHMLPVLIPGDQEKPPVEVKTKGLGIGLTNTETTFSEAVQVKTVRLKAGDTFIIYSDGVVEAAIEQDGKAEQYGDERFLRVVEKARAGSSQEIVAAIVDDLDLFYGENPRVDDHTVLAIQRCKQPVKNESK